VPARPFLKWAGGKGQLLPALSERLPERFLRYHEPFVGGGALFFHLWNSGRLRYGATLSDFNRELIECYQAVRDHAEELIARLLAHKPRFSDQDYFYEIRSWDRQPGFATRPMVERAARTIFLNRTCYNGLYRVNSRGQFNVPHGRYANPRVLDAPGLASASDALQRAELSCDDFETACAHARAGDFVYLDPPYYPLTATARFTDYTVAAFGPAEHGRLRDAFEELTRRGVHALLSNSDHEAVRALYEGRGYGIEVVRMSRAINSVGSKRQPVAELLIDNTARVSGR
jgi:DNA adenine methylase